MNLAPYRKLVAYAVAAVLVLVLVARYAGLDLSGTDDLWVEAVILIAGGWGIYTVPNAPCRPGGQSSDRRPRLGRRNARGSMARGPRRCGRSRRRDPVAGLRGRQSD
ncbi:MAG: hypothetical protein ABJF67_13000 [Aurantimonas coralicida]